jgi:predicted dehydrogenase
MPAEDDRTQRPIAVAAVGLQPDGEGVLATALPPDGPFDLVAYCDEGLPGHETRRCDAVHYTDYNVLLQESPAELVLVMGPVEKRRDFAVRALNAGKHAVLELPFCEDAADAERVMKTALQRGLVATADLPWRRQADLRAVRAALDAENLGALWGVLCSVARPQPEADAPALPPLLEDIGLTVLDQVHLLLSEDVRSVSAHMNRRAPDAEEAGFMIYMPLRKGGWAAAQAACGPIGLPRWTVYGPRVVITADAGHATVVSDGETRTYDAPPPPDTFWDNLRRTVREGDDLLYHPASIVRAMKLLEAARESAEVGEPVTI